MGSPRGKDHRIIPPSIPSTPRKLGSSKGRKDGGSEFTVKFMATHSVSSGRLLLIINTRQLLSVVQLLNLGGRNIIKCRHL